MSSTCYDLHEVRAQLRGIVSRLGHEPVMSDYSDVLFDPREHTHESCIKEVGTCDALVLVLGGRFGGKVLPKAMTQIDFDKLRTTGPEDAENTELGEVSVTQLEVLKAISDGIPTFAFVSDRVWHDHAVFEANKELDHVDAVRYPSIEKAGTARYIFNFINFVRKRSANNAIVQFSKAEDIEHHLGRQWSGLFQSLLQEQRTRDTEQRRLESLTSELADLKAAVMGSISSSDLRDTAKGAIKFRRLIEFVTSLDTGNAAQTLKSDLSWDGLLQKADVVDVCHLPKEMQPQRGIGTSALILSDGTYYVARFSLEALSRLAVDWDAWKALSEDSKTAITEAILESAGRFPDLRRVQEQFRKRPELEVPPYLDEDVPF